jgi:glutamyl-tRNA reductase
MASVTRTVQRETGQGKKMQIALIGCNHRTAPVEFRERIAFTPEQALRAADELRRHGGLEEALVLSTCNRSELYGVSAEPGETTPDHMESFFTSFHELSPAELNGRLYRHTNAEAVRHLFRVAAGLDSMLLGEAEILGQVRDAYSLALEHGATGPVLNRLFQGALEVGKRVRAETELGARPMSVAFAGVKLAERVFGKFEGHKALVIGAGAMAEQVVDHLRNRGIKHLRIVNRSREHAEELARRTGGEAADWAALEPSLGFPDIVVSSVSGEEAVITRAMIERAMAARSGRAMFIMDLGLPRNVEAGAARLYSVYLYNLDDLGEIVEQNKKAREAEIPRAEEIINEHVAKFAVWQTSVEANTLLEQLRQLLHDQRQAFLEERLAAMPSLSPEDRQRVNRLTEELIEQILAGPARRLRHTRELRRRLEELEALRDVFGLGEKPKDES